MPALQAPDTFHLQAATGWFGLPISQEQTVTANIRL